MAKYRSVKDKRGSIVLHRNMDEEGRIFSFNSDPLAKMGWYAMGQQGTCATERILGAAARFVMVGNQIGTSLDQYVFSTFGPMAVYPVTTEDVRGLSIQLGNYSMIIALIDDVARAKRVFREIRDFGQTKLCYAIMTESSPQDRSSLIRFLFDDVFDTRMKPAEILLRIQSQCSRQRQYDSASRSDAAFETFCEENIIDWVPGLHLPLLRQLFDNMGHVARYRDLAAYDFHSGEFRLDSLTVRIHNLRRRLKNYEIRCERGVGYILAKCPAQSCAEPLAPA